MIGINFSYSTPFAARNLILANSRRKVTKKESEQKNEREI